MLFGAFITTVFYVRQQYYLCSKGCASWYGYQHAQAEKTATYSQDKCLPLVLRNQLKPFFKLTF